MVIAALTVPVTPPESGPPESGLIAVCRKLNRLTEDTTHQEWESGGYTYRPIAAGPGAYPRSPRIDFAGDDTFRAGAAHIPVGSQSDAVPQGNITAYSFILSADESCSAFGWKAEDYQARAKARLEALQSKILEQEFWRGQIAQAEGLDPNVYDWLAKSTAVDLTPAAGAVDSRHALSIIEEALGDLGTGAGFIHVTRQMGMLMPDRWSEGLLFSQLDSTVVLGSGYTGTGPDGSTPAAGSEWVYGTNNCDVRLGPVEVFPEDFGQALDKRKNTISFRAERFAAVSWDGYAHVAVRTTTD